ncbi:MAG: MFS transporter [Gammaproteobacteria bacterium]|nr:MFS transporter [Gammaproteobacteria bacterium]
MRLLISFAALFLSISLLQLSSGAIGPLDALAGLDIGFSKTAIGLLGSAHFLGFFIGCWWAPRLLGKVGHARTFAIFSSLGAIGAIAHPLILEPDVWAVLRVLTGLCVSGCYTVIEAWFQAKLTKQNRGRVMGIYRAVDIVSSSGAQLMIGLLDPASYISYNILAIMCCTCLLPLALTTSPQPVTPEAPRLRPIATILLSPLGAAGVLVAGLTSSAFRMVGPLYAQEISLTAIQTGYFLATVMLGGALAQYPAGWLADRYDRRQVLFGLSAMSALVCFPLAWIGQTSFELIISGAILFGVAMWPIFSVSAAHTNDFANPEKSVEVNASLMFIYGIGAIFSPLIASMLLDRFGPSSFYIFIGIAHLVLVTYSIYRMRKGRIVAFRTRYTIFPRTTFQIGRLLRRTSSKDDESIITK